MFLITSWQPVALQLSFAVAIVWGSVQNQLIRQNKFREMMGLTPMPIPPKQGTHGFSASPAGESPSQPPSNPFVNNPFADLRIVGSHAPKVEYKAPTARETLGVVTLLPSKNAIRKPEPQLPQQAPSKFGIVGKVMADFKEGQKGFMAKMAEHVNKHKRPDPNKKGNKGRSPEEIRRNQQYERKLKMNKKERQLAAEAAKRGQ